MGLTPFIIAMMRAPVDKLAGASVEALAGKYGIPVETARFYLAMWMQRA